MADGADTEKEAAHESAGGSGGSGGASDTDSDGVQALLDAEAAKDGGAPKYMRLDARESVLLRPSIHMGDPKTKRVSDWIFDERSNRMVVAKDLLYNQALLKVISEVIDNALDVTERGVPRAKNISVTVTETEVTISNDGAGIAVTELDFGGDVGKAMVPTTIFGVMNSGQNFTKKREQESGIGLNGVGAKLANITSSRFEVQCFDKGRLLMFTQVWEKNMSVMHPAHVEKVPNDESKHPKWSTVVTFKPDLAFFNGKYELDSSEPAGGSRIVYGASNEAQGSPRIKAVTDVWDLVRSRLVMVQAVHKGPLSITLNGVRLDKHPVGGSSGFKSLAGSFFDKGDPFTYVHVSDSLEFAVGALPRDVPSGNADLGHMSFVNSQRTSSRMSNQVGAVEDQVVQCIAEQLKSGKNKVNRVNHDTVKKELFWVINSRVQGAEFGGQLKETLKTYIFPVLMRDYRADVGKLAKSLKASGVLAYVKRIVCAQEKNALNRIMSTERAQNFVKIDKLHDAHDAGTRNSEGTMLFLVEGDSAQTMVTTGRSVIKNRKFGSFPLKGKMMNVRNATRASLGANAEVKNVMKALGLNFKRTYETPAERKTLRYERLCILCDADVDGIHITALIINFVAHFWPALVTCGDFLYRFVTPVIKATRRGGGGGGGGDGDGVRYFFTTHEYAAFEREKGAQEMKRWDVKHLKGLGTSETADTLKYFRDMDRHLKTFTTDGSSMDLLSKVMSPNDSPWRKKWLRTPADEASRVDFAASTMNISNFLRTEMHDFSLYSIKRSLPSACDGLKVTQRKIIHACLKTMRSAEGKSAKVSQLSAAVAADTVYAHGDTSMQGTMVKMAQSYAGSNNVPLLVDEGAFGSRRANGSDAASARYIFTKLTPIAYELFKDRSPAVLEYLTEENASVEPAFYVPSLPVVLLNGSTGIATGFSTVLPCFSPWDVIQNVRARINPETFGAPVALRPYYTGTYSTNHLTRETSDGKNWVFEGSYKLVRSAGTLIITEIPIGCSFECYHARHLAPLQDKGNKVIGEILVDHIDANTPRFVLRNVSEEAIDDHETIMKTFALRRFVKKSQINLLDEAGLVRNFPTPEAVLDFWWPLRVRTIEATKANNVKVLEGEIDETEARYRFIKAIVEGRLVVHNRPLCDVKLDMAKHPVSVEAPDRQDRFLAMHLSSISRDKYLALANQLEAMKDRLEVLKRKTVDEFMLEDMERLLQLLPDAPEELPPTPPPLCVETKTKRKKSAQSAETAETATASKRKTGKAPRGDAAKKRRKTEKASHSKARTLGNVDSDAAISGNDSDEDSDGSAYYGARANDDEPGASQERRRSGRTRTQTDRFADNATKALYLTRPDSDSDSDDAGSDSGASGASSSSSTARRATAPQAKSPPPSPTHSNASSSRISWSSSDEDDEKSKRAAGKRERVNFTVEDNGVIIIDDDDDDDDEEEEEDQAKDTSQENE